MTVKELREILANEWIGDDLVITNYDDQKIDEVVLTLDKDGICNDVRIVLTTA